ncbi:MAG TPA: sugar transferase [Patescibacteria group bacterium]|nr:sugar transferase [Patescibacteria group bacterium]
MYQPIKRLLDIIFAVLLAIVFFPVWLVVPLLIWIDSGSPVIYKHQRVGQNQKAFWLYKFRTMIKNADDVLYKKNKKLLQQFKRHDWKLKNDPRVTRLGRLLRNLTIDEFPQIINVLKGEMSLVGPRAYIARELKEQTKKYPKTKSMMATIFTVKPGITGPWQTSGRNEIPFDKRAKMDLNYAKRYNLISDLLIILRTPKAMLSKW